MVTFADCFATRRDPKHGVAIRFLLSFISSLRLQSQIACSLSRDFEAEYPLLSTEFDPETSGTCNTVSKPPRKFQSLVVIGLMLKQVSTVESQSSSSPLDVSGGFELHPNIPNQDLSIQVRSADMSSLGMDPTQYDWNGPNFWDNQVMDTDYTSLFQNAPDVRPEIQRINSPAQPAGWKNNKLGAI